MSYLNLSLFSKAGRLGIILGGIGTAGAFPVGSVAALGARAWSIL